MTGVPATYARLFLRYGYVPEPDWNVLQLFNDDEFLELKRRFEFLTRAELIAEASRVADSVFEETFANLRGDIVIPISGGRDSRFILCMALEHGLRDRVTTLTWGAPDGLDCRISAQIAAKLGLNHHLIDTTRTPVSYAQLKQAFDNGAHWTDLQFAHFNQAWRAEAPDATAIIGYLGGPPVGCHYEPGYENYTLAEAIAAFEDLNQRTDFGDSAVSRVGNGLIDAARISLPEQLDLVYRQHGYLRRIVAPAQLNPRTPCADPRWMRTMYAMPGHCRVRGNLFTQMLVERFPRAFAIGASGAYGLRADAPNWRRVTLRRARRIAHVLTNLRRKRGFSTFDKYGDERDLLANLAMSPGATPIAYADAVNRADAIRSRERAADVRLRAMLSCNFACAEHVRGDEAAFAA